MTENEDDHLARRPDDDIDSQAWTRLDKENEMANIEDMHDDNDMQV